MQSLRLDTGNIKRIIRQMMEEWILGLTGLVTHQP